MLRDEQIMSVISNYKMFSTNECNSNHYMSRPIFDESLSQYKLSELINQYESEKFNLRSKNLLFNDKLSITNTQQLSKIKIIENHSHVVFFDLKEDFKKKTLDFPKPMDTTRDYLDYLDDKKGYNKR